MDRKINGFSLIELLVVIAIMTIILSIGIPNFFRWIETYRIESDTKNIYAFIQQARMKAFTEKIKLDIVLENSNTPNRLCLKCDSSDDDCKNEYGTNYIQCIDLKRPFNGNQVNISKRGTLNGGPVYFSSQNDSEYDCVRVSDIRVKMEKCNGNP
ncbi:prepilin-type N-terminal cleavage/methylation domain-containing protein [Venenivibrio stagnispumantis]|uniref:Prepilin-type N-terminal cleavage/methylation domain-containing protein n=1 Tax=Venenivibrio stagnispumantis TaxID=407998 RepID=A0AA46AE57_9AQUI|nr:prepilin-type N-terminal cleavage/methylation domain-containing protein [Venenivibrio stagnispumantis]MCW4573342.1 prepilin-type N-terminal cleavage/methylation domain-containing protein [Venenivibrio stagnispumantis]SMP10599.1 prepilin-type N-terminal cleavage/methylation domain-containing protein [Venenivibrio stagnispumantis]